MVVWASGILCATHRLASGSSALHCVSVFPMGGLFEVLVGATLCWVPHVFADVFEGTAVAVAACLLPPACVAALACSLRSLANSSRLALSAALASASLRAAFAALRANFHVSK